MNIFQKYGGTKGAKSIVNDFIREVKNDDNLKKYFAGVDFSSLISHQVAFISVILGGPNDYLGKSMKEAHQHLEITTADYQLIMKHFLSALRKNSFEEADISYVKKSLIKIAQDFIPEEAA